jgi:hypothetical protein
MIRLLLLLLPVMAAAAVPTGALNRLYEHQAVLAERLDSLRRLPLPEACEPAPLPRVRLERKARLKPAEGKGRIKLPAGSTLTLVSQNGPALAVLHEGRSLRLDHRTGPAQGWSTLLHAWRGDSLACRIEAGRRLHGQRLRLDLAERDLARARELETLYRRPGTHLKVEPDRMVEGSVLPRWSDSLFCLDWLLPDSLACATDPWGAAAMPVIERSTLPPVLRFLGLADDWITFRRLDTGDSLYCHREEAARRFAPGPAAELHAWSLLDARRSREARRFELLKRWEPELVDRLLEGLVWKGMTREMLDEALGPPSGETARDKTVIREYARGSRITLTDGRVTLVEQAARP